MTGGAAIGKLVFAMCAKTRLALLAVCVMGLAGCTTPYYDNDGYARSYYGGGAYSGFYGDGFYGDGYYGYPYNYGFYGPGYYSGFYGPSFYYYGGGGGRGFHRDHDGVRDGGGWRGGRDFPQRWLPQQWRLERQQCRPELPQQ